MYTCDCHLLNNYTLYAYFIRRRPRRQMHVTFIFRFFSISILLAASLPSHIIIKIDFKKISLLRICHRAAKRGGCSPDVREEIPQHDTIHPSVRCVCVCIYLLCVNHIVVIQRQRDKKAVGIFLLIYFFLHANNI